MVTREHYARYLVLCSDLVDDARMGWWGDKSVAVIICYRCRKRISPDELLDGLHDHDWEPRPEPVKPAADSTAR